MIDDLVGGDSYPILFPQFYDGTVVGVDLGPLSDTKVLKHRSGLSSQSYLP